MAGGPADYHRGPVGFLLHGPSAVSRHLRRDPWVHNGHPDDRRCFLPGVGYLGRTGIPWWEDLSPRFHRWCQAGAGCAG